jgi:TolB-like protein
LIGQTISHYIIREKLGEIITNLLITDLSESRYVSVVSSQRLYDILKLMGKEGVKRVDRSVAAEVATRAKSRRMLLGDILTVEPRIVITTQLVDVKSGRVEASQRVTGDAGQDVFPLVDRLAVEIRNDPTLPAAAAQEPDRAVADVTTHSREAYRFYLEGCDYFYKLNPTEAEKSFRKAIEHDPTFAMAYYMLSKILDIEWGSRRKVKMIEKAISTYDRFKAALGLFAGKAYYLLGLAYERSGMNNKAVEKYEEFLDIWKDADPAIKEIKKAKERLAKLKGKAGK